MIAQSEYLKSLESAEFIQKRLGKTPVPEMLTVLGSGFKAFTEDLDISHKIPMSEIPYVQTPKVAGHGSNLLIAKIGGKDIAVFDGRIHLYEGYSAKEVVFTIRTMAHLGVKKVLLTNASGGLRSTLSAGEVLILNDQINFTGQSCLVGHEPELGAQFVDMVDCFNKEWRECMQKKTGLKTGVYLGLMGPAYETPAETRCFGNMGADVVGMSTVLETIAARQMGLRVGCLSLVTNLAGGLSNKVDHADVLAMGKERAQDLKGVLTQAISAGYELN